MTRGASTDMAKTPETQQGGRAGGAMFKAIERESTLASRVAEQIEELIVGNKLASGQRLLSERELGERFGVSRTVVREAVRALAAKGLLEVRTGDGTYVRSYDASSAAEALSRLLRLSGSRDPSNARSIYEVRRPLELAIAELAAARATPEQLAALQGFVAAIEDPSVSSPEFVDADVGFHLKLAEATQNNLFVALLNSVSDLMSALREVGTTVPGAREDAVKYHRTICERVAAHDVAGARRAMSEHMDASEAILDRAVARMEKQRRSPLP